MTKNIDFYFDFISPYSYIGHRRIELQNGKLSFTYKPILLGGLHKLWNITPQAFIEPKKKFMIMDCEMVAKKLKIDFKFNSKFPLSTVKLMRGCLVLKGRELQEYIKLIFNAYWRDDKDITDNDVLSNLLKKIEINFDDFLKRTEEISIKEKLKTLTNDAHNKNIFGAPTFVVNNKNFWGQDRIEFAIEELNFIS